VPRSTLLNTLESATTSPPPNRRIGRAFSYFSPAASTEQTVSRFPTGCPRQMCPPSAVVFTTFRGLSTPLPTSVNLRPCCLVASYGPTARLSFPSPHRDKLRICKYPTHRCCWDFGRPLRLVPNVHLRPDSFSCLGDPTRSSTHGGLDQGPYTSAGFGSALNLQDASRTTRHSRTALRLAVL
jgi:hypothetical protein